jgi:rare lipoprotein A
MGMALALAACGTTHEETSLPSATVTGQYKVGKPYTVNGVTYRPRVQPGYDETGIASWYGPNFHGKYTANGERYDMNKLTAAHRTLPMPSYVRVTNLENGRALVLRVNDRGPFTKSRIIDVSRRAAQLLGFERSGTARVRVQAVEEKADAPKALPTPQPDNRVLADKLAATEPAAGPPPGAAIASSSISVTPLTPPSAAASSSDAVRGVFVQVGAFSSEAKAKAVLDRARSLGSAEVEAIRINGQTLYRVRLGPYGSDREAEGARAQVSAQGFPDARVVND